MKLSTNFDSGEFRCHCGTCEEHPINPELIERLEELRARLDTPILVLSGHRCSYHNRRVGGAKNSQHVLGKAADITTEKYSPSEVYDVLTSMFPNKYGMGIYSGFVHFDVREGKARWDG